MESLQWRCPSRSMNVQKPGRALDRHLFPHRNPNPGHVLSTNTSARSLTLPLGAGMIIDLPREAKFRVYNCGFF